jgi:predicted RNA-binding protein with PUA-like domain
MNTWIFQSNPKSYQIDNYLNEINPVQWSIRQKHYKHDINIGDEVYIWRSDGYKPRSGGIVAKGTILSLPELVKDKNPQYFIDDTVNLFDLRVDVNINEVRLSKEAGMIRRIELEKDRNINDLFILKIRNNTNYKIDRKQADYLKQLWNNKKS